jgi:hypothetical protein
LTENERDGKGIQKERGKENYTNGREYKVANGERR